MPMSRVQRPPAGSGRRPPRRRGRALRPALPPAFSAAAALLLLLGLAMAWLPEAVAVAVALAVLITLLLKPSVAIAGYCFAAVFAEWGYEAHRTGLLRIPSTSTAVVTWSIVVLLACWLASVRSDVPFRATVHPRLTRLLGLFSLATAISVAVDAAVFGSNTVWSGTKGVIDLLAPIGLMSLFTRCKRRSVGLTAILSVATIECLYGLVQISKLQFGPTQSWFTVGTALRWWDSRAMFGTFASTGNHSFANALVFLTAVTLPWSLRGGISARLRMWCLSTTAILVVCAILSLTRVALVGLCAVALVTLLSRKGLKLTIVLPIVIASLLGISATSGAFHLSTHRGINNESTDIRLTIWAAMVHDPRPQWLIGEGYGQVGRATTQLNVSVTAPGAAIVGPTTDNLYLRRLIEQGILGVGTLIALLVGSFRESLRPVAADVQTWQLSLRGLIVALAVMSITSDTIFFAQEAAIFGLCFAACGSGLVRSSALMERRSFELSSAP